MKHIRARSRSLVNFVGSLLAPNGKLGSAFVTGGALDSSSADKRQWGSLYLISTAPRCCSDLRSTARHTGRMGRRSATPSVTMPSGRKGSRSFGSPPTVCQWRPSRTRSSRSWIGADGSDRLAESPPLRFAERGRGVRRNKGDADRPATAIPAAPSPPSRSAPRILCDVTPLSDLRRGRRGSGAARG